jgi:hypothetical protein
MAAAVYKPLNRPLHGDNSVYVYRDIGDTHDGDGWDYCVPFGNWTQDKALEINFTAVSEQGVDTNKFAKQRIDAFRRYYYSVWKPANPKAGVLKDITHAHNSTNIQDVYQEAHITYCFKWEGLTLPNLPPAINVYVRFTLMHDSYRKESNKSHIKFHIQSHMECQDCGMVLERRCKNCGNVTQNPRTNVKESLGYIEGDRRYRHSNTPPNRAPPPRPSKHSDHQAPPSRPLPHQQHRHRK